MFKCGLESGLFLFPMLATDEETKKLLVNRLLNTCPPVWQIGTVFCQGLFRVRKREQTPDQHDTCSNHKHGVAGVHYESNEHKAWYLHPQVGKEGLK